MQIPLVTVCRYGFYLFNIPLPLKQPSVRGSVCVGESENEPNNQARSDSQSVRY